MVDQLLALYHSTLPGVYLDLALPTIPTPPSSAENSDCSQEVNASVYNTVTSTVSGMSSSYHLFEIIVSGARRVAIFVSFIRLSLLSALLSF